MIYEPEIALSDYNDRMDPVVSDIRKAMTRKDAKWLKELLNAGPKLDGEDGYEPPIFYFCKMGELALHDVYGMKWAAKATTYLLQHGHANPNLYDEHGMTPLMWAAFYGHTQLVDALLRFGAKPNLRQTKGSGVKQTALMRACRTGKPECVRLLLMAKADTRLRDADGYNAWDHAIISSNGETKAMLKAAMNGERPKPKRPFYTYLLPRWRR